MRAAHAVSTESSIPPNVKCFVASNPTELATAATSHLLETFITGGRGVQHVALSGGSTPKSIYEAWAASNTWSKLLDEHGVDLHLWYGDVRMVPEDSADSNSLMVRTALAGTVPADHIHGVDVSAPATEAAAVFATALRGVLPRTTAGVPIFDVVMLGVGPDGHTASLFPGTAAPSVRDQICVACMPTPGVKPLVERVTITTPVIQAAKHVVLIAAGADKSAVLRGILATDAAMDAHPDWLNPVSRLVRQCSGSVTIIVDSAMANGSLVTE